MNVATPLTSTPARLAALAVAGSNKSTQLPEAAPLKPRGGDPYYGLSRSFWYSAEREGIILLTRVRLPNSRKPRVLLRREDADAAITMLSRAGRMEGVRKAGEVGNEA